MHPVDDPARPMRKEFAKMLVDFEKVLHKIEVPREPAERKLLLSEFRRLLGESDQLMLQTPAAPNLRRSD